MALPKRPQAIKLHNVGAEEVRKWDELQVADWLEEVNDGLFANYVQNALELKLNGADLINLTDIDMQNKLEITIPNHVTTLLASIERLKKKSRRSMRVKSPNSPLESVGNLPNLSQSKSLARINEKRSSKVLAMENTHSTDAAHPHPNHIALASSGAASKSARHIGKAKSVYVNPSKSASLYHIDPTDNNSPLQPIQHSQTMAVASNNSNVVPSKYKRYKTVANIKDEHKSSYHKKNNTLDLKRQLTEQQSKKGKYSYKDIGKKLWPSEASLIVKEGWMKKRGVRHTGFKERWCVLRDNGHLYYFEKRPTKNSDLPQGMLDLGNAQKVQYVDAQDPNTFSIKTGKRNWIFSTMSGGELVQWMSALNKIIEQL